MSIICCRSILNLEKLQPIIYYPYMEYLVVFNRSIVPIMIIITIAFAYNKLYKPNIAQIASVALNVFAPIMVFYSVLNNKITVSQLIKPFLFMVFLTLFLIVIAFVAAMLLKLKKDSKISFILASSMINVGNFGLPLIYFAYGNKAISYSTIYFVIFNIPLITIAIYLTSKSKNVLGGLADILRMPIFYAFIIAILLSELGVCLPKSVLSGLGLMNSGAIALLVFILGLQLANIKLKGVILHVVAAAVFIRLLLSPMLSYSILTILHIGGLERMVSVVQTSTPSALLPLMYMISFKRNSDLLAAIIFTTTVLSGITLPILIGLLH